MKDLMAPKAEWWILDCGEAQDTQPCSKRHAASSPSTIIGRYQFAREPQ
jgi:hypothetical protein